MATTTQRKRSTSTKSRPASSSGVATPSKTRRPASKTAPDGSTIARPESITNYTTAVKWLYDHIDHERLRVVRYDERTFNISRMQKLLGLLGHPHSQLKAVQVVGTKGKGSTCAMLASMMQECGHTVGLYSSPHLIDLRERIQINGDMISYSDMAAHFKQIAAVESAFKDQPPTFFEILTASALLHFADQAVDVAVLETGLGGRLDCVSAVDPRVIGVTQISLDHTHLLGETVEEIAREKAGAFKPGVPVISVKQEPAVADVLREVAEQVGCPLRFTGQDIDFSYRFEANKELGPHTRVCLTSPTSRFEHLPVPLKGEHQALNCGLSLALLDELKAHGLRFAEADVIEGLSRTDLPGRMEVVHERPRVIIDGAHNAASLQALIRALGAHIQYDSLVMVFGCAQDKDIDGMLKQVALGADKIIFTRAKANPRACEPADLLTRFGTMSGKMAQKTERLDDALRLAARAVSREDLIIVCGSFYLAGEARKFFIDAQAKQKRKMATA